MLLNQQRIVEMKIKTKAHKEKMRRKKDARAKRRSAGKCFLDMLGVFGEFETNLRRERQMEGVIKAKAEGKYKGRKPSVDVVRVKELRAEGMGAVAIAKQVGCSRASVYIALKAGA